VSASIAAQLVGPWALRSFVVELSDGRPPVRPFGEGATGLVVYAATGWMSAVLASGERGGEEVALETAAGLDADAKVQAFDSYLSYAGRWELVGQEVHHHVTHALVPGVVGTTLRRRVSLLDGQLTLSYTRPTRAGATATYRLDWSRP